MVEVEEMKIAYFCLDRTSYHNSPNNEVLQSAYMAKTNHEVYLFTEGQTEFPNFEKPANMHFVQLPIVKHVIGERNLDEGEMKILIDTVKKCDCIFGSAVSAAPLTIELGKLTGKPVCNQILDIPMFRLKYQQWWNQWKPWLEALANSNLLICNTKRAEDDIRHIFRNLDKIPPIKVVYYGIDDETSDIVPPQEKIYDVCMVGRFVHCKQQDLLLYALAQLKQGGNNLKAVLIGDDEDMFRLRETALNAELDVTFAGAVSDEEKWKLIKQSRIGVYADCCESISGLAPAEYMYCGLPSICMDMPINRERFGTAPFYVPKFNVYELAKRIEVELFRYNSEMSKTEVEEGKRFIKDNRLFKQTANGILAAMETIIK
jgi:glycosyltransferase involved in cell wall biosynthesis